MAGSTKAQGLEEKILYHARGRGGVVTPEDMAAVTGAGVSVCFRVMERMTRAQVPMLVKLSSWRFTADRREVM